MARRRGESQAKASGGRKRYARSYKAPLISRDRGVTRACEIIIYATERHYDSRVFNSRTHRASLSDVTTNDVVHSQSALRSCWIARSTGDRIEQSTPDEFVTFSSGDILVDFNFDITLVFCITFLCTNIFFYIKY